jgi:radical SAM-linked protein
LKGSVSKVRYLIKFTKEPEIKFISHLDIMRTIQRGIRRADLPIEYSKGFNPHMGISIAQPLSVGIYSEGEYMDVIFTENLEENYIVDKLSKSMPLGIKVLEAKKIAPQKEGEKKTPQSMAAVDGARYTMEIRYVETEHLKDDLKDLYLLKEWNIVKKTKSGEKETNIKPMIKEFKYELLDNVLHLAVTVSCGSRENLSAELLGEFIKCNTKNVDADAFVDIRRDELLGVKDNKLMPLSEVIS